MFDAVGEELAGHYAIPNCPEFRAHAEGGPRDLAPLIRDEVHRAASDAVRNAFRHLEAGRIEAEVWHEKRQFRLRVSDEGKGVDQSVLTGSGRIGHFGLSRVQERAKVAGGKLTVYSRPGGGTKVKLTILDAFTCRRPAGGAPALSSGRGVG